MSSIKENLKVTGSLLIELSDPAGNVREVRKVSNLVVTTGKEFIASRMKDATATAMSHMAVGTNNTAAAAGDTTLGAELARVALGSTTVSTNTVVYQASFPAGTGTGALVESGIFNATPGGTMLARTVFAVVNKGADDALTITWTITIS